MRRLVKLTRKKRKNRQRKETISQLHQRNQTNFISFESKLSQIQSSLRGIPPEKRGGPAKGGKRFYDRLEYKSTIRGTKSSSEKALRLNAKISRNAITQANDTIRRHTLEHADHPSHELCEQSHNKGAYSLRSFGYYIIGFALVQERLKNFFRPGKAEGQNGFSLAESRNCLSLAYVSGSVGCFVGKIR